MKAYDENLVRELSQTKIGLKKKYGELYKVCEEKQEELNKLLDQCDEFEKSIKNIENKVSSLAGELYFIRYEYGDIDIETLPITEIMDGSVRCSFPWGENLKMEIPLYDLKTNGYAIVRNLYITGYDFLEPEHFNSLVYFMLGNEKWELEHQLNRATDEKEKINIKRRLKRYDNVSKGKIKKIYKKLLNKCSGQFYEENWKLIEQKLPEVIAIDTTKHGYDREKFNQEMAKKIQERYEKRKERGKGNEEV